MEKSEKEVIMTVFKMHTSLSLAIFHHYCENVAPLLGKTFQEVSAEILEIERELVKLHPLNQADSIPPE